MSEWIMWAAALLPAAILWLYIWKKDSKIRSRNPHHG